MDDAIVARTDLGIRQPSDLEGKQLAILTGTTSHRFADLFIDYYGLDRDKIEFVNLSPPSIQASLIQGTIPAGSIWQPFRYNVETTLAEQGGGGVVQFTDRAIYTASALLAVRSELARERPEDIEKFLRALIKAEDYVANNTESAIETLSGALNVDSPILRSYWSDYDLRVNLKLSLEQMFTEEGAWVKTQDGFRTQALPSYANILNQEPLRRIDPSRILQ